MKGGEGQQTGGPCQAREQPLLLSVLRCVKWRKAREDFTSLTASSMLVDVLWTLVIHSQNTAKPPGWRNGYL